MWDNVRAVTPDGRAHLEVQVDWHATTRDVVHAVRHKRSDIPGKCTIEYVGQSLPLDERVRGAAVTEAATVTLRAASSR